MLSTVILYKKIVDFFLFSIIGTLFVFDWFLNYVHTYSTHLKHTITRCISKTKITKKPRNISYLIYLSIYIILPIIYSPSHQTYNTPIHANTAKFINKNAKPTYKITKYIIKYCHLYVYAYCYLSMLPNWILSCLHKQIQKKNLTFFYSYISSNTYSY